MQFNSSQQTLFLLALREIRLEIGTHPGHLALFTGSTPKEWAKIETGKTPLTLQAFTAASYGLCWSPSRVMSLAELLMPMFTLRGWYFQPAHLGSEDDLLPLIDKYYASSGYKALMLRPCDRVNTTSLLQGNNSAEPTIVRYCCDQIFRKWVDAGAQGAVPTFEIASGL